jgi:hypothetical protein
MCLLSIEEFKAAEPDMAIFAVETLETLLEKSSAGSVLLFET